MAWWQPDAVPQEPSWAYANWDKNLAPALLAAQQGLQTRGLDPSNPWAMMDTAFPADSAAKLRGAYGNDLLDAARKFMAGQRPAGPGPDLQRDPVYQEDPGGGVGDPGGVGGLSMGGVGQGGIVGATPAATAAFGGALGAGFGGIPGLAINALGTALSGQNSSVNTGLNAVGLPSINFSNPISQAFHAAFPTMQVGTGPFGENIAVSPLSDSIFSGFAPSSAVQSAAVSAINSGNAVAANALEGGITPAEAQAMALAGAFNNLAIPSINAFSTPQGHPAFGFLGFNPPSQSPRGAGQVDTEGDPSSGVGPPGEDDGGMGGVGSGAAGGQGAGAGIGSNAGISAGGVSGTAGTGTAGGVGVGGPGGTAGTAGTGGVGGGPTGGAESYRGGPVSRRKGPKDTHKGFARKKGTEIVPIKAHEGEFVVNSAATQAARPQLEALNALIPPPPRNKQDLAAIMDAAKKYFDVVA